MQSDVILRAGIELVIAEAAQNAGVGAKAGELIETGVERVAMHGDEVAGDQRDVRAQFIGGVHYAGKFRGAEECAQMNIADLDQAQAGEIVWQSGYGHVHFANAKIGALEESSPAHYGEWRNDGRAAGCEEPAAARRIHGIGRGFVRPNSGEAQEPVDDPACR